MINIKLWIGNIFGFNSEIESLTNKIEYLNTEKFDLLKKIDFLDSYNKELLNNGFTDGQKELNKLFRTTNLIYTKRYVLNHLDKIIPYDVRDFIYKDRSLNKYNFKSLKEIFEYKIKYVYDKDNENYEEFWQLSQESSKLGVGDCEDSTIFRINAAKNIGIKNIFFALGFLNNIGHAFPIYYLEGKWYVLEATNNIYNLIEIKNFKGVNNGYKIYWIFDETNVWVVDDSISFNTTAKKEFKIKEDK